jgi:hypothetical protein
MQVFSQCAVLMKHINIIGGPRIFGARAALDRRRTGRDNDARPSGTDPCTFVHLEVVGLLITGSIEVRIWT